MAVVESSHSQEGEGPERTKNPKTMRSVKLSRSSSRKSSTAKKDSSTQNKRPQSYWPSKGLLFGKKNSTPKTEQGETKTEENSSTSSSSNLDTSAGGSEHHSKLMKLKSRKLSSFASFLRSRSNRGQKSITIPSDEVSVSRTSSLEVSVDVSPEYSDSQASRRRSGTTFSTSNDSKASSSGSQSKSSSSESKSGIILKKNSSLRKILKKRNSYKLKGNSKPAENESKTVEKATCSSALKNSKFPKRIDLKTSQTVCPYNHCSLHGPHHHHHHHNLNQTLPNRFAYLKRNSENTLHGVQTGIHTEGAGKSSNHPKGTGKVVEAKERISDNVSRNKKRPSLGRVKQEIDFSIEFYAKTRSEQLTGEGLEKEDLDLAELLFGVKNLEINSSKTKIPNPEKQTELNEMISQYDSPDEPTCRHEKPKLKVQPMKVDKKISTSDGEISNIDSSEDDSYETKEAITTTRASVSQPATAEDKPRFKMSMWHMIHREMVSGLVGLDTDSNSLQRAEEEKQCRLDNAKQNHEANQGSLSENPEVASPEIELRKTFAVNLVRDAIEKILLTEIQDDRFITRYDFTPDEDLPENKAHEIHDDRFLATCDFTPDEDFPENNAREIHDDRFFANDFTSDLHYSENNFREIHGDSDQELSENDRHDRRADDSSYGGETKPGAPTRRRWSEAKKVVLLQRFVNELEKVKSFDLRRRRGPQPLLEVERGAERVSLRRQGVGERKNAEEWMLDYALRRVVGELAPAQKRKVALLVQAFETVAPT